MKILILWGFNKNILILFEKIHKFHEMRYETET